MYHDTAAVRGTIQARTIAHVAFGELAAPALEVARAGCSTDEGSHRQITGS